MNSVASLCSKPFSLLSAEEKLEIKKLGRPTPELNIVQTVKCKSRQFTRNFNQSVYEKHNWLCGCDTKNALYCFPCLLFTGEDLWTKSGVTDLNHLTEKIRKHESSKTHMKNVMSLVFLGTVNVAQQLDSEYRRGIALHNEQVKENRYILNIIINCIRFCGAFELALRGYDESDPSPNPGVNFSSELDISLKGLLEKAIVFKETSKTIQNELLQIMLEVCQEEIAKEIHEADFLSVIADETSDVSNKFQMVIVFRYIVNGKPVERFWKFITPEKHDAKTLASCILIELERLGINENKQKLITQTYDGAAVMGGCSGGVQAVVKESYPHAEYVHCHAHELNLVILNAASVNRNVRIFFADLQGICTFFSTSSERTAILDEVVKKRSPCSIPTKWNFHSRSVNTVFENREEIIQCLRVILEGDEITNTQTICLASGHMKTITSSSFKFWLSIFYKVMRHVEILFDRLQKKDIDPSLVNKYINSFEEEILRFKYTNIEVFGMSENEEIKRRKTSNSELRREANEVCDVIICQFKHRFKFTGHLVAATLFQPENFQQYDSNFPEKKLKETCEVYRFLDFKKLKTELAIIYSAQEFRSMSTAVSLLEFIRENNLQGTLSECVTLLKVLITIPMTTSEADRCFSTLKRIKTFLRNTMLQERLSALAMLSIEKLFIADIPNFNEKVVDKFAQSKERRMDFLTK